MPLEFWCLDFFWFLDLGAWFLTSNYLSITAQFLTSCSYYDGSPI